MRGLGSTKRHLCGSRWDDDEIIRLAFLMEKGEIVLDSLDVQAPNNVGGEGIRAFCRALLFGANELTALRVRADAADDAALLLLAATLSARDTRREALSRVQHADATQHVPPHAASGGSVLAADDELAHDAYFAAAPMLHEIDIAGGARTSAHAMNAISAARRSRLVLAPASEASMRALAAAARMPSPLRRFRASFNCTDGSAEHLEARRQLFSSWDSNASGCLSLAEVGNGVLTTLSAALGQDAHGLYHRFCTRRHTRIRRRRPSPGPHTTVALNIPERTPRGYARTRARTRARLCDWQWPHHTTSAQAHAPAL
jgi:hypothetical protein